jgi:DnaJ-domain-containing protein 1
MLGSSILLYKRMAPHVQRILKVDLPFDQTMVLIKKALEVTHTRINQIEVRERRGVALATTGFSFWSWGEKIMVLAEDNGLHTIVRLLSKSSQTKVRRDWGKNRRNLDGIEAAMHRLVVQREALFAPAFSEEDTPYKVLDISPDASRAEVLEAYHQKVRLYHPDRLAGLAPELRQLAEERMKAINAAFKQINRRSDKD